MSQFFFYGAPMDTALVVNAIAGEGMELVAHGTVRGKIRRFKKWDPAIASLLEQADLLFVSGAFTVDIRIVGSGAGGFVSDQSGPLLSLIRPFVRAHGRPLLRFVSPPVKRPAGPLVFHRGGLYVLPFYYQFTPPRGSGRDYDQRAQLAYRGLVKALKKVLIKDEDRWLGPQAFEWAQSGPVEFL